MFFDDLGFCFQKFAKQMGMRFASFNNFLVSLVLYLLMYYWQISDQFYTNN